MVEGFLVLSFGVGLFALFIAEVSSLTSLLFQNHGLTGFNRWQDGLRDLGRREIYVLLYLIVVN